MLSLVWCPPGWCCGNLYLVPDPAQWHCPFSGVRARSVLTESDWLTWLDPAPMLRLFRGRQRKLRLLADAAQRAGLAHLLPPSGDVAPPEQRAQLCNLIRDLFGYPCRRLSFSPMWLSQHAETVVRMARSIDETEGFEDLPILADALEEAGCTEPHILDHCRAPGFHARGCWVLDLLLGNE
jgi:hypothetical protein